MTQPIHVQAHIDADGILRLEVPTELADADVEVDVSVKPRQRMTQAEWEAFLDRMNGILAHDPLERGEQGEYEVRE